MAKTYRQLAIVCALIVVALSSWPSVNLPNLGVGYLDKVLHFGQYTVLAFLVVRGWVASGASRFRRLTMLIGILILFAALDEYHQGWIPGRDPDWWDWIADALGIGSGSAVGAWLAGRERIGSSHFKFP
jgi:VanZ family protein